ncbi:hypothetical protein F220043C3_09030 [Enterocloster asparagiformis]
MFITMDRNMLYNDILGFTKDRRDLVSLGRAENETGNIWQNIYHQAYMWKNLNPGQNRWRALGPARPDL